MKNLLHRPLGLLLAVILVFGLSAPALAAESSERATVTITGNPLIPAGSTGTLTASFDLPAAYKDYTITYAAWNWTSSDADIAKVNASVDHADFSSTVDVEMKSTLRYQTAEADITASVEITLAPPASDDPGEGGDSGDGSGNGSDGGNSSDGGTATVSDPPETVTLTGSKIFTVYPDYAKATGVSFSPIVVHAIVEVGSKSNLYAEVSPFNADQKNLQWYLGDGGDKVVRLNTAKGQAVEITGVAPGTTTVTVQVPDSPSISKSCNVTVPGIIILDSNNVTMKNVTMKVGDTFQLTEKHFEVGLGSGVTWSSNNMSVVQVGSTGQLSAISAGTAVVTATIGEYSATCDVTVEENTASTITNTLSAGQPLDFDDLMARLNEISLQSGSASLDYITNLSVSTAEGIIHYGYASGDSTGLGVGVSEVYYRSPKTTAGERGISDLTFVPKSGFTGTAVISYTGYSTSKISFTGKIKVNVESTSDIVYTTSMNTPVTFDPADFNDICRVQTGRALSYVTFDLPSASRGTLCYNYNGADFYAEPVTRNTRYHVSSSPRLDKVTFVPAEDYAGTLQIGYTGTDASGKSFTGYISITVDGGGTSWDGLTYQVNPSGYVDFKASDFNAYCRSINGTTLSYVRFTLPSSSKGSLYYNYSSNGNYDSAVSNSNKYYYSKNPSISNISFVAGNSLTSVLFIDFVGYDTSGKQITGKVCIEPSETRYEGTGDVYYTARAGQNVTFDAADFNEVSLACTGERLHYVTFELPASNRGTLYYNYSANSVSRTKVSATNKYYRNSYYYLSQVTFVPASNSTGTVPISFTGYDMAGTSFTGTVWISVEESGAESLSYTVASGKAVNFSVSDFNSVCRTLTGSPLNYVRFALPESSKGVLCYQYNSSTGRYSSKATSTTSFYRTGNSRLLSDISFLADAQYSGTVEISYTGWSTDDAQFTGTIKITVTKPTAGSIRYTLSSTPVSLRAADLTSACKTLFGTELASIKFTSLPDQTAGRLYLNYVSPNKTGNAVSTGRSYYLKESPNVSDISFVPNADFKGDSIVRYTATDAVGATFSGTITFSVSGSYRAPTFSDMGNFAWANPSVEFLYEYDIVNGVGGSRFGPAQYIRRGDFVLMLCRAFGFDTGSTSSFSDVPKDSYYARAIATAKDLGIVQGTGTLFLPQSVLTRQDAMVMIKRAMSAAGISVSEASTYLLSYYADGAQVQSYARDAVATLVQAGVVTGSDTGALMPLNPIRRAEMAVILHRVLTL